MADGLLRGKGEAKADTEITMANVIGCHQIGDTALS